MARTKKTEVKLTDKELEAVQKIKEYKRVCEANVVSSLWKMTDLFYTYDNLTLEHFMHNEWKVYWQIGYDLVIKEHKQSLDEITINLYLEKHKKLKEKYNEYGGFTTIEEAKTFVATENIEGYIKELNKWNTVMEMIKNRFPVAHRIKEYVDMSLEEIYDENEALLNHIFINADSDDKTYKLSYKLDELIDELDEGLAVGLPLADAPMLTDEIGGNLEGNITLMGGLSGIGKTTISRMWLLPSIIEHDEKLVIMINEEGLKKWQREMLIWVANNIFKKDTQKYKLRNGKYTPEFKKFLKEECVKWIKDNEDCIIIKPFQSYTTAKAIKTIKKYAALGVKYFMLDTYKADSKITNSEAFWFNMQQNMVEIYDVIKAEAKNLHIWITFQLAKSSTKNRCYTQDNIGMAKNIVDVASTCLMIRQVYEDEFEGQKNELKVYKTVGKTKIQVKLDEKKHYVVVFVVKNREGASNDYQIVAEADLSRNTYREIGVCCIPPDF